jgi:hypothetical protein
LRRGRSWNSVSGFNSTARACFVDAASESRPHAALDSDTLEGGFTPERVLCGQQSLERLIRALYELPPQTQAIFTLYHFEGVTQVDIPSMSAGSEVTALSRATWPAFIARPFGCSRNTMALRLARATHLQDVAALVGRELKKAAQQVRARGASHQRATERFNSTADGSDCGDRAESQLK